MFRDRWDGTHLATSGPNGDRCATRRHVGAKPHADQRAADRDASAGAHDDERTVDHLGSGDVRGG
jgi:hypothetical protein